MKYTDHVYEKIGEINEQLTRWVHQVELTPELEDCLFHLDAALGALQRKQEKEGQKP